MTLPRGPTVSNQVKKGLEREKKTRAKGKLVNLAV